MDTRKEVRRVLEELQYVWPQAKKFETDAAFSDCLANEIQEAFADESLKTPEALFEMLEDGNVGFVAIVEDSVKSPTAVSIPLSDLRTQQKVSERKKIVDAAADLARESLELDMTLKKSKLIDHLLKNADK
jgi:hypothetical protein